MRAEGRSMGEPRWTFVVFGDDWGRHVSSMQHLFLRLLDRSTVVWIDGIGHREPSLSAADARRALQKVRSMVRGRASRPAGGPPVVAAAAGPRPHVHVHPRVLPWHLNPVAAAFNRWSLRRDIGRAIDRALALPGADPSRLVMVTGSPPSASVAGTFGERAVIYFCMDDFLELPGTSPHMMDVMERRLLARADAVVATAQRLVEKKRCAAGRGWHLPQGVNYAHFAEPRPVPPELARLPRPIIGFAGGVGAAVHADTVAAIARANASGSVVLVGPVTLPAGTFGERNVHLLGPRPYADLPAYVQAFDAGIIPYVENDWTRAVDPLKLLEYLAAGIPVVASPLPEVMKYAHAVEVAPLGDAFVDATMRAALATHPSVREQGRAEARLHTWDARAERFMEMVEAACGDTGRAPAYASPGVARAVVA